MDSLYLVPGWFYYIDIVLGLAFAVISLVVANYAFKINKITKEFEFNLFGTAFLLISLSYILRVAINSFLTSVLSHSIEILEIKAINILSTTTVYVYAFLFITGYATFAYTTIKNNSKRMYYMILVPSLLAFALSENKSLAIYLITTVFLVPICFHYGRLFLESKNRKRSFMFIATLLLLMSNVISMFVSDYVFYQGYIISEAVELIAYSIIGFSLYKIINNGEKKN